MTTIKLKNGSGAPTAGDLAQGEPALDLTNKRLYTEDSGGNVIEVGTNPTSVTTGDITATGTATFAGLTTTADVSFGDNDKAIFGAGSDLQIYHDGSSSYIVDNGTGNLQIDASDFRVRKPDGSEAMIHANADGAVKLFYDGGATPKLATTSTGIDVTGTVVSDGLTLANATYIKQNDSASGQPRVLGFNAANNMYVGPIDSYAGGAIFYGVSSGVSSQVLYTDAKQRLRISSGGDVSLYEDTGTTAKFQWSASNERLTIPTLTISDGSITTTAAAGDHTVFNSTGADADFRVRTGANTHSLYVQGNTGNVGIGTDSPSQALDVVGALKVSDGILNAGVGGSASIFNEDGTTADFRVESSGNTHMLFVDGGLNKVGIGTSSPASKLDVAGTTPTLTIKDTQNKSWTSADTTLGELAFRTSDTSGIGAHNVAFVRAVNEVASSTTPSGALSFGISASNANASEAMRIDSSGNLLVGKTAANNTSQGTTIYGSTAPGAASFVRDAGNTLVLNRLNTDGEILAFRKDSSTVGSIGTKSADLCIGTDDTGIRFGDGGNSVIPHNMTTNVTSDGVINFGTATERFKDLYLSGGVYLGGTGSANKLDDYEEGTWTPAVNAGSISGTSITYTGSYTKIGRQVYIYFNANSASGDINISSYVTFSGLPFSITYLGTGTAITEDIDQFDRQGFAAINGTTLSISNAGSSSGTNSLTVGIVGTTS